MLGLLIGKPVGITLCSWLAVRLKFGRKPADSSWMQFVSMSMLAGIGFTMSIFITMIAFSDGAFQDMGKIAVLLASLVSAVVGIIFVRLTGKVSS